MNLDDLVQEAQGEGVGATAAAEEIGRIGPRALPSILDALDEPWPKAGQLGLALEKIYSSSSLDVIEEALDSDIDLAFEAAVKTVCSREGERETHLLISHLTDAEELVTRRAQIAEACGYSKNSNLILPLEATLDQSLILEREEDEPPRLIVACVVALARHGRFQSGSELIPLVTDPFPPTRALAAEAFLIAISTGMISSLSGLVTDVDYDVRLLAIEALSMIGLPACVGALTPALKHEDNAARNNCRISINDILGTDFPDRSESYDRAIVDYWRENVTRFDPRKRYRNGVPATVSQLIDRLAPQNPRCAEACREITFLTGYQLNPGEVLGETVQVELLDHFSSPGVIYRWGREVHADQIL
ncbi:HEAT repeat domain-containing protein [Streptomyces sp. MMS24-I2-30]|uniref:HEAT repeat domain-containing protein n=1 Tax=Streptomyces sp. MMS24-I2-30 TaxID=3351564 RepID=UPI003896E6DF